MQEGNDVSKALCKSIWDALSCSIRVTCNYRGFNRAVRIHRLVSDVERFSDDLDKMSTHFMSAIASNYT